MKKQILALAAFAACLSASAAGFDVSNAVKLRPELHPELVASELRPETTVSNRPLKEAGSDDTDSESEEVYYTLAGDPYTALSFNNQVPGMQVAMAFQFDPSFLAGLTDGKLTGITYYTGTEGNANLNKITKAYVFIAEKLGSTDAMFLYTQEVQAPTTPFTRVDVKLDEPFDIPADKKLYAGVYFNINSANNAAVVVDYAGHMNEYGGWYAVRSSSKGAWSWDNLASSFGFLTLGATVTSSSFPRNSVEFVIIDGQPAANVGEPFGFQFLLGNTGVNDVESISVEYGIDGQESVTEVYTMPQSVPMNQYIIGSIPQFVSNVPTKSSDLTLKVTAVNGEPNTAAVTSGSYPVTIVPEGKAKDRNVVIEEFTGTWCQYCPVGYTTMEMIREAYTDGTVIPVCIHVSDPMSSSSYNSVYNNYSSGGVPSSTVNRTYDEYPYFDDLAQLIDELSAVPGIAEVTADATLDPETRILTVNSKTSFSFDYTDGDQNFILAYGVTEDGVGPYNQTNGYSGSSQAVFGGWEKESSQVSLVFNDVARQLEKFSGITGSIPAELATGEEYEYTHSFKLLNAISNLEKINVVVYLLNRKSGAIENACVIKAPSIDQSGIDSVIADSQDAPVEYFNLQGIRVSQPSAGVYIRRQGENVSKVLVR